MDKVECKSCGAKMAGVRRVSGRPVLELLIQRAQEFPHVGLDLLLTQAVAQRIAKVGLFSKKDMEHELFLEQALWDYMGPEHYVREIQRMR